MTQTCLGENLYLLQERIRNRIILCSVILAAAIGTGVVLVLLRTPENHNWMQFLSILLTIGAGWLFVWNLDSFILPYGKLIRLYQKPGREVCGVVEEISQTTKRYHGFDCTELTLSGHKLFVVENGSITLKPGQQITAQVVHGIVKEVAL